MKRIPYISISKISLFFSIFVLIMPLNIAFGANPTTGVPSSNNPWQSMNLSPKEDQQLKARILATVKKARGVIGIGIYNTKTQQAFYYNGNVMFPMASTYKVAIGFRALQLVQQGKLTLSQLIPIESYELVPGGLISNQFYYPGVALSVQNLLSLMIRLSDNTASDKLLSVVGGPESVTQSMRSLNINGIIVSRSTLHMIADSMGIRDKLDAIPVKERQISVLAALFNNLAAKKAQLSKTNAQPHDLDVSSPIAMVKLLRIIDNNEALQPELSDLLLQIMSHTVTGKNRIKGRLPRNIFVAHKTGTLFGALNDVGVITLPNNRGDIVIVVFVKNNLGGAISGSEIISQVARIAFDFFNRGSK